VTKDPMNCGFCANQCFPGSGEMCMGGICMCGAGKWNLGLICFRFLVANDAQLECSVQHGRHLHVRRRQVWAWPSGHPDTTLPFCRGACGRAMFGHR
jgi:hypothetical protein